MSYKPTDGDFRRVFDTATAWGRMQERQAPKRLTGAQKWHWLVAGLVSGWGSLLLFLHLTGRIVA